MNEEDKFVVDSVYNIGNINIDEDAFLNGAFIADKPIEHTIIFNVQHKEILRIDEDGFHFNGETIEDAGEAYKAFMEVMGMMKNDNAI